MKKSLILAMAMALGSTASAYAANSFSDVPAGHWAYDSVAKLAADGVVDGYADGLFDGEKLMTRYEMAQIVAKAMAKGANVDKLAAEFADELDALGVRVAKLESKADAVKITGEVRYHYMDVDGDEDYKFYDNGLRTRIWVQGKINNDWTYTGMLQNVQDFTNDVGDEDTEFKRAYVEGKIGGVNVLAGRYNAYLVNGNLYDEHADGIELTYGKDVKLTAFYMKPTDQDGFYGYGGDDFYTALEYDKAYGVKVDGSIGIVNATVGYTVFEDGMDNDYSDIDDSYIQGIPQKDNKVWNIGAAVDVLEDLNVRIDYLKSNMDSIYSRSGHQNVIFDGDDGIVIGLSYKGAKASVPGSYGIYANYYNQSKGTVIAHTMNGFYAYTGFEGYMVGANYALAKNVVAAIEWYDLKEKSSIGAEVYPEVDMQTIWAQVVYTF